jgi:hypothetical protein
MPMRPPMKRGGRLKKRDDGGDVPGQVASSVGRAAKGLNNSAPRVMRPAMMGADGKPYPNNPNYDPTGMNPNKVWKRGGRTKGREYDQWSEPDSGTPPGVSEYETVRKQTHTMSKPKLRSYGGRLRGDAGMGSGKGRMEKNGLTPVRAHVRHTGGRVAP